MSGFLLNPFVHLGIDATLKAHWTTEDYDGESATWVDRVAGHVFALDFDNETAPAWDAEDECFVFDGASQFITAQDHDDFDIAADQPFAIGLDMEMATPLVNNATIVNKRLFFANANAGWGLRLSATGDPPTLAGSASDGTTQRIQAGQACPTTRATIGIMVADRKIWTYANALHGPTTINEHQNGLASSDIMRIGASSNPANPINYCQMRLWQVHIWHAAHWS